MAKFVFMFHGGERPETEEAGKAMIARWMAWVGDLGEAMIDEGAPVGMSSTVSKSGVEKHGGANPISGYSIVEAGSIEAACEMAKGCPLVVDGNGSVEVAEVMSM